MSFDAYVRGDLRRGLGTSIRDHEGKLLIAGVRRIDARWPVEVCETAVGLFGIELALRLGYEYIHLEGDALTVVQTIESKREDCFALHLFYDHISVLSARCKGSGVAMLNVLVIPLLIVLRDGTPG